MQFNDTGHFILRYRIFDVNRKASQNYLSERDTRRTTFAASSGQPTAILSIVDFRLFSTLDSTFT